MQIKVSEGGHVFSYFGPVGFSIVVHCPRRFLVHYRFYECVYRKDVMIAKADWWAPVLALTF